MNFSVLSKNANSELIPLDTEIVGYLNKIAMYSLVSFSFCVRFRLYLNESNKAVKTKEEKER